MVASSFVKKITVFMQTHHFLKSMQCEDTSQSEEKGHARLRTRGLLYPCILTGVLPVMPILRKGVILFLSSLLYVQDLVAM